MIKLKLHEVLQRLQARKIVKAQKKVKNKIRCGSDYGGFDVILDNLKEQNKDLIVYSFGIGKDLTFSEDIDRRFSAQIFAFDPTPKSIEYVQNHFLYQKDNFHFIANGISVEDCRSRFYLPENEHAVSGSLVRRDGLKGDYVEVDLRTLKSFMDMLGHKQIDILKMDIEGSEFEVVPNILKDNISFSQLCVEVHHRFFHDGNKKLTELIATLNEHGYYIGSIKGQDELTFIKCENL